MPARIAPVRVSTPASVPSGSVSTATSTGACSSRSNTLRGSVPAGAVTKSDTAMSRTRVNRSTPTQLASVTSPIGRPSNDHDGGAVCALVDQRRRVRHRIVGGQHDRGVDDQVAALDEVDRLLDRRDGKVLRQNDNAAAAAPPFRPSGGPPPRSCSRPPPGWWCPTRHASRGRRRTVTARPSVPGR